MAENLHLSSRHREEIEALLHKHLPGVEVWAYGSRVNGRSHDGSDLDLVLRGPKLAEIDISRLADFIEALQDSTISFLVEARDWARLPESFHHEIEREHVALVEREESLGTASDGWVSLSLGEVCTKIGSGATPRGGKEVYLKDGPYALIRSQNVYNHRFNHDGLAFINQHQATELNNVEVFADDVLLNITGDSVARACQVAPDVLPARVNQHVAIIRPDPHKLSPHFLRYFLVCPEIQAMLLSWAGSGGTRNALTKGMIESFDVQAPMDVDEQRAIAHILGTLDDKIELNRRMNATLEAMARALFKSWFVDFDPVRAKMAGRDTGLPKHLADLFPDRLVDSELGEIPEGWEVKSLDEIAVFQNGLALQKHRPQQNEERLPVVKIAQLRSGQAGGREWASANIKPECIINDGGIVFSWSGSLMVTIWCGGQAALNQHLFKVTSTQFPKWFCLYCTESHLPDFRRIASGKATTMGHIKRHHLTDAKCVVPTWQIFSSVDNTFSSLLSKTISLSLEPLTLAALRDTLLPKLVSGELRVVDNCRPC